MKNEYLKEMTKLSKPFETVRLRGLETQDPTPKSFYLDGTLYHEPKAPTEPARTLVTYELLKVRFVEGDTLEDMLRRLPAGTPLRDIRLVPGDRVVNVQVKREKENTFFEEEMKVFHIQQLAYEAAMKLWTTKVMAFKQHERSVAENEFETALDEKKLPRRVNLLEDAVTRQWLKSLENGDTCVKATQVSSKMTALGKRLKDLSSKEKDISLAAICEAVEETFGVMSGPESSDTSPCPDENKPSED